MAEDGEEVSMRATPAPKNISFDNLDPTELEEFCHDLLGELDLLEQRSFKQGVTMHRYAIRDVSEASPC